DVVVLDVRPGEEYRAGHIPGAVSIPVDELETRLGELPEGVEVVAYCRGPYCVFARDAVAFLRRRGRSARRLVDGLPEWRLAGLPIAAGERRGKAPGPWAPFESPPRDRPEESGHRLPGLGPMALGRRADRSPSLFQGTLESWRIGWMVGRSR